MAYVLVAVGAVMFFAGVYAAVTGSEIVQVEAGWTSVIAGSILVVGGVLTMALGLVLRALLQLKASLPPQVAAPVNTPALVSDLDSGLEPMDAPPPPAFGEDPASAQVTAAEHAPEPSPSTPLEDPFAMVEPTAANVAVAEPAPPVRPPPLPLLRPKPVAPKPAAAKPPPLPGFFRKKPAPIPPIVDIPLPVRSPNPDETQRGPLAEPEPTHPLGDTALDADLHEVHETSEPVPLDPRETAHPSDDYKIETPSTSARDLPSAPLDTTAAPGLVTPREAEAVDWLDRAFAEMDESLPVEDHRHEEVAAAHPIEDPPTEEAPLEVEPAHVDHEPEPALPELEYAATERSPEPPRGLPRAATLSPPTSAVIGRYEADGTSYVMYADGSIEAHSEAGTYRFASMSELKSFIET